MFPSDMDTSDHISGPGVFRILFSSLIVFTIKVTDLLSSWNVVKAILSVSLWKCAAYWTKPVTKACESPNKAGMLMSCEFPHANQTRSACRSDVLCKQTEIKHKVYHFKTSKTTIKSMGWFLLDFKQHILHKEIGGVFFFPISASTTCSWFCHGASYLCLVLYSHRTNVKFNQMHLKVI